MDLEQEIAGETQMIKVKHNKYRLRPERTNIDKSCLIVLMILFLLVLFGILFVIIKSFS